MAEHKIVTIGRQFGSGGHEIGNRLATRLDIPLYVNNLVRMVAEKLDIREETAQAVDDDAEQFPGRLCDCADGVLHLYQCHGIHTAA